MYYDPVLRAYIDADDGSVVYREEEPHAAVATSRSNRNNNSSSGNRSSRRNFLQQYFSSRASSYNNNNNNAPVVIHQSVDSIDESTTVAAAAAAAATAVNMDSGDIALQMIGPTTAVDSSSSSKSNSNSNSSSRAMMNSDAALIGTIARPPSAPYTAIPQSATSPHNSSSSSNSSNSSSNDNNGNSNKLSIHTSVEKESIAMEENCTEVNTRDDTAPTTAANNSNNNNNSSNNNHSNSSKCSELKLSMYDDINYHKIECGEIETETETKAEAVAVAVPTSSSSATAVEVDGTAPIVATTTATATAVEARAWDDWTFARALQVLEFEISAAALQREQQRDEDFQNKELHSSSCRRQLLTASFAICLAQVALMIAVIQEFGYAPQRENPVMGPPAYGLVEYGAKVAYLIAKKNEWWRLLATVMLHGGIWHIIPNVLIQLRIGGYLNLIFGTPKWLFIYFISGVFGGMMSCIFLPDSVGVGSSGALLGILCAWLVWIIFRWKKIPPECRGQRNCQLGVVLAATVVTLATSFSPNVDWAAHFGGSVQGALWGAALLSNELDNSTTQVAMRISSAVMALGLIAYSLYYMIAVLDPDDPFEATAVGE